MSNSPLFRFGMASDVQYAGKTNIDSATLHLGPDFRLDKDIEVHSGDVCYYRDSLPKLEDVGDIIDGNLTVEATKRDLESVLERFERVQCPTLHHVIGNHCLQLPRDYLLSRLKIEKPYHSFLMQEGWRGVILDGSDISLYGWKQDEENYRQAKEYLDTHDLSQYPSASSWNAGIGEVQKQWLRDTLKKAKEDGERCIVFCHYPLLPEAALPTHLLWNGQEIADILGDLNFERTVVAYFCGHLHRGGYVLAGNRVHHYTVKGIVECPPGENVGAIVEVHADHLFVRGFGQVEDQRLDF
ncbi:hypothetical protein PROFUN_07304 [Planoprotostelium fungivorum]|uniref:Uncharacterized protein n=1 Tax=Planoprotostelium fungivorum TaxID=1890364 RepID=A0A2P6NM09_9EUKA|nr:hypothetical protein PROFUN_07304 [Planoprotostelium fungivorum]